MMQVEFSAPNFLNQLKGSAAIDKFDAENRMPGNQR